MFKTIHVYLDSTFSHVCLMFFFSRIASILLLCSSRYTIRVEMLLFPVWLLGGSSSWNAALLSSQSPCYMLHLVQRLLSTLFAGPWTKQSNQMHQFLKLIYIASKFKHTSNPIQFHWSHWGAQHEYQSAAGPLPFHHFCSYYFHFLLAGGAGLAAQRMYEIVTITALRHLEFFFATTFFLNRSVLRNTFPFPLLPRCTVDKCCYFTSASALSLLSLVANSEESDLLSLD